MLAKLFFLMALLAVSVAGADIVWNSPQPFFSMTQTANKDVIAMPYYNATFNYSSGEIESLCFSNDPDPGDCYELLGTKWTNPDSWADGLFTDWELQRGGSGVGGDSGSTTYTLTHTNSADYGKNNEICMYREQGLNYRKYTCQAKDTFGTHKANITYTFYPTYYEVYAVNSSGADTGHMPSISLDTEWINDTGIATYNGNLGNYCGCNGVTCDSVLIDIPALWQTTNNLYVWGDAVNIYPGRPSNPCNPATWSYRMPYFAQSSSETLRVGWDNQTPNNDRVEQLDTSSVSHLIGHDDCTAHYTGLGISVETTWGSGYHPKYYTEESTLANIFDYCEGSYLEDDTWMKLWKVDHENQYWGGLSDWNRSFYMLNKTYLVYSAPEEITAEHITGDEYDLFVQNEPIENIWYNRTWTERIAYNITPTETTIYPTMRNLSFNLSNYYCDNSECTWAKTHDWRLVNDMLEPIDFVVKSFGTGATGTAMVYFQGYQLYSGNATTYFLYTDPNATVTNRTQLSGDTAPSVQNFTFSEWETIIENTTVTAGVPSTVYFSDVFEVTADYLCAENEWGTCTPGEDVLDATCDFTTLTDSYPMSYSNGLYRAELSAGETAGSIVWSISCSKSQYLTSGDSGTITVTAPCGFDGDAFDALQCSTDGVKGFFVMSSGSLTNILLGLFVFTIIATMFGGMVALAGGR